MFEITNIARKYIPAPLRPLARRIRFYGGVAKGLLGVTPRTCPCCGYIGKFNAEGSPPRYDAECKKCMSRERHRLFKIWVEHNLPRSGFGDVLHFAPEQAVGLIVRPLSTSYVSADILEGRADLMLDIEHLALEDESLDTIVCFHILEHVDDRKALGEIRRVLRPGGSAYLMFPFVEGWADTYEAANITSGHDRRIHFGQADHVRIFGRDVRARIRDAGFTLAEYVATPAEVVKFGLLAGETLFIARK